MSSKAGRPEAIVRPRAGERAFEVERLEPDPALAEVVDYYWLVRWDVTGEHRQQVVPQPRVHVAAEDGRLWVHGVSREPFFRTLTGVGHVLGAAFHPGGFRALLRGSVGAISGTVRTAEDVLGHDDRAAAERILATSETAEIIPVLDAYLLSCEPDTDPTGREATELVNEVQRRPDIVRAEQLAEHAGLSTRSLQRLFSGYVGIGPKWVIQRSRLLDATAAAHSGEPVDWSGLATTLGFSDQAHLTRVFTQVVGTSPERYRRDPGTAR